MSRLALALILAATTAGAQDLTYGDDRVSTSGGLSFNFRAGVGVQSSPDYFGASTSSTGATGSFEFGSLNIFGRCFGCDDTQGFGPTGSFRYIGARDGEQDVLPDSPLSDIDAAIEVGGGLSYTSDTVTAFAVVRRGFGGHTGYVAEIGGDYIVPLAENLSLSVGPRVLAGDDTYVQTYFGTDAGFAGPTPTPALSGGLVSRGVEIAATYDFDANWGVTAKARYDQLLGDAADSSISTSDDQTTLSLVLTRNFNW